MVNDNTWSAQPLYGRDITQEMRNVNALEREVGDGSFIGKWGSQGSGNSQFEGGAGITIDNDGNVWVVDSNPANDRVQKFTATGSYILEIGGTGTGPGQMKGPVDIDINPSGNIVVVESTNRRVQEFNTIGVVQSSFGVTSGAHIAIDSNGNHYLTHGGGTVIEHQISKYDSSGAFQELWGTEASGSEDGLFNSPQGLAVDSNDLVYVSDRRNSRIQVFNSFGVFQYKFSVSSVASPQCNWVTVRRIGADDRVYVNLIAGESAADFPVYSIKAFTTNGVAIGIIGGAGSGDGGYDHMEGIAGVTGGKFYAVDRLNYRVQYYDVGVLPQTAFVKYTTGGTVSLGTPNGGLSVPLLAALDSGAAIVAPDHIIDIRTAIEALAPFYTNAITGNAFNWNGAQADSLYRIALGNRDTSPSDFGFSSPTPADDWQRTKAQMENNPTYDIDIGEVALCIDKLQASALE